MRIFLFIKRALAKFANGHLSGRKSVVARDNGHPFAADRILEEKARNEYLDSIGYPKELRD